MKCIPVRSFNPKEHRQNENEINSFVKSLLRSEATYNYVKHESELHLWDLWDSNEIIICKGVMYDSNNLLESSIYFIGDVYVKDGYDDTSNVEYAIYRPNCILECHLTSRDKRDQDVLDYISEFYTKLRGGEKLTSSDFLGSIMGADTPYEFVVYGKETAIVSFEDDICEELYDLYKI